MLSVTAGYNVDHLQNAVGRGCSMLNLKSPLFVMTASIIRPVQIYHTLKLNRDLLALARTGTSKE
jgi:hypothetical protein